MIKQEIIYNGKLYYWSASQEDEHPGMSVYMQDYAIYIQVMLNQQDKKHNDLFFRGQQDFPIPSSTAYEIIKALVDKGYIETYKNSDVGLVFDEHFNFIEI